MQPCQLLCACAATYDIVTNGTLPLDNPYVQKAGFTQPPVMFAGGDGNPMINACMVGTAGNAVIAAFRGTMAPKFSRELGEDWSIFLDWVQDIFLFGPVAGQGGLPGMVHKGFQDAFLTLWPAALPAIQTQMAAIGPGAELYVTGHSKGGPLANFAAWCTSAVYNPTCVTFASARPGNPQFAEAYNTKINSTRYEFQDDIVPHMPPTSDLQIALREIPNLPEKVQGAIDRASGWNYISVGTLQFIDWTNQLESPIGWLPEKALDIKRLIKLTALLTQCGIRQVAGDHTLAAGYCKNVCPEGTCS